MTNDRIIKHLTKFREIAPRSGFARVSRRSILAERQSVVFAFDALFRPLYVGGFAAMLLVITLSYALLSATRPAYASLNIQNIQNELDELTINIKLEEIAYSQSADRAVASALQEIANDKFRHLNPRVLQSERDAFEIPEEDGRIDDLLNTVIF
ncbi:MAG: hypothetical protein Q8R20_03255 [Nanoarchaeota archaeon]|nr:hypothetical protein [Nanoarchaeota archaeon]